MFGLVLRALLPLSVALAAPDSAAATEAAREVLASGDFQTELPAGTPAGVGAQPPRPEDSRRRKPVRTRTSRAPEAVLARAVLWLLLAVALVAGALGLWRGLAGGARGVQREPEGGEGERELRSGRDEPSGDARDLAAEGRFTEAIHALLLGAVARMGRELGFEPAPALTARELMREAPISTAAREALGELVWAVELAVFGGRAAGREEFERCLAASTRFAGACRREAP